MRRSNPTAAGAARATWKFFTENFFRGAFQAQRSFYALV
jgi:hypothetical protein